MTAINSPLGTSLVWLTVALPLLTALLYSWHGLRPLMVRLAPWTALPALVLVFVAPQATWVEPWLLLGSVWGLTDLTRPFLGVTAVVWLCAGLFSQGYFPREPRHQRFYLWWLLTLAGNLGLILAQDMASFYTCFGLMTFAAYGLIVHPDTPDANRAGRIYLIMAVIGEALLLAGLILAGAEAGGTLLADLAGAVGESPRKHLIMALLWLGFGIKAGAPLLHMWLPLAHPAAPTPASAVLSGTMIKAGLLGWLLTMPLGTAALPGWGEALVWVGLIGAFGGALFGVAQHQPKAVLAYSSISQMGLITVMVGAGLRVPHQWPLLAMGIGLYAVHHGLAKGALFLGVGAAQRRGRRQPLLVWVGLALPALALAGLPFSSGAFAKAAMKAGLHVETGAVPPWWDTLPMLLSLGAVGTTLLMARFLWLLRADFGEQQASAGLISGWGLCVLASLTGIFWLPLVPDTALKWEGSLSYIWGAAWPIGLALVLSVLVVIGRPRYPAIPPGDLLVWVTSSGNRGLHQVSRVAAWLARLEQYTAQRLSKSRELLFRAAARANSLELWWLREGALVGLVLVVLLVILLWG